MTYELHLGDCLDIFPTIPDKSVDCVICDPPYGTTKCSWDIIIPFEPMWEHLNRIAKKNAPIILFGNQPFTSKLIVSNIKKFKQCLTWNKNKCGSPGLAKIRPMQVVEDIIVFANGRYTYNPIMEIGVPYTRKYDPKRKTSGINRHDWGLKGQDQVNFGTRYPKSIINISRNFSAQQQVHPTQKPVPLLEYLVKTYSNRNDVVLDFAFGYNTTGVACRNLGRSYIGIEKDPEFFELGKERVELLPAILEDMI